MILQDAFCYVNIGGTPNARKLTDVVKGNGNPKVNAVCFLRVGIKSYRDTKRKGEGEA